MKYPRISIQEYWDSPKEFKDLYEELAFGQGYMLKSVMYPPEDPALHQKI